MRIALRESGIAARQQSPIAVRYEGEIVGDYFADLLVEGPVIVEVKAAKTLCDEHDAQLLNYLRATGVQVGLLLNFGPTPEFRRKVMSTN